jgi:hypothetical protein
MIGYVLSSLSLKWIKYCFNLIISCNRSCRLGGVVVSVLATGPKVCGFKTRPRQWIIRAIKIRSTSSRMGSKAGRSHVVRLYGM